MALLRLVNRSSFRLLSSFRCFAERNIRESVSAENRVSLRMIRTSACVHSKQPEDIHVDDSKTDEPIKYSTSSARSHSSYDTFFIERGAPWYQMYLVLGSTTVFLIYFLALREENDLDEEIGKSLFERISGLEEQDLKAKISNAKAMGLDSKVYEKRLMEIQSKQ